VFFDRPDLVFAFSQKPFNMSLSSVDPGKSLDNRRRFLQSLSIEHGSLVCGKQTHSANVRTVGLAEKGRGALEHLDALPDTDALITPCKGLPLSVFTADCLSIFLYSLAPAVMAVVHAGWKGTRQRIAAIAAKKMIDDFRVSPDKLNVAFGPCIRDCCYQVGAEFSKYFSSGLVKRGADYYLDLSGLNRRQLLESGIIPGNIYDSRICTSCRNTEFFSFRREGERAGRMMSVIMLK